MDARSDEDLLRAAYADTCAFAEFYRRHVAKIEAFAARRLGHPEEVVDLVATVFLEVLQSSHTFDPRRGRAVAWLYGVAARQLAASAPDASGPS